MAINISMHRWSGGTYFGETINGMNLPALLVGKIKPFKFLRMTSYSFIGRKSLASYILRESLKL